MVWTRFMDMHSGGPLKEPPYEYIYIEAKYDEAKIIFYNRFGHNPDKVSCSCCGPNYSIGEEKTLEQATGFERGCKWIKGTKKRQGYYAERPDSGYRGEQYKPLAPWLKANKETALVIPKTKIKKSERIGDVPVSGWIYV